MQMQAPKESRAEKIWRRASVALMFLGASTLLCQEILTIEPAGLNFATIFVGLAASAVGATSTVVYLSCAITRRMVMAGQEGPPIPAPHSN